MKFLANTKLSPHKFETSEGYLICKDAVLARTGKQTYMKCEVYPDCSDTTEIDIDRKPEDVFSNETLASFENKPITVEHPNENVTTDNYKDLSVGFVRDIRRGKNEDGEDVMLGNLVITDPDAIEDIKNGIRTELSCGYDCDITNDSNPRQINIRGNHVALCECGRAGIAKIVDSKDSINDMALSRADAMDRCISLGSKFIEHFDKIYNNKEDNAVHHWISEMNSWLNSVRKIKLKNTNDVLLNSNLRDWFFTAGANAEDFMTSPSYNEIKSYDKFVELLINGSSIENALKEIGISTLKVHDVNPKENESKKDFIARFMKETKSEYPDTKQRYAVALSYWENKTKKDSVNDVFIEDDIINQIEDWVNKLNALHESEKFADKYSYSIGPRWIKIYKTDDFDEAKTIFAFVDPNNGDIYKPASYNAPAKGVRANVSNPPMTIGELYRRDSIDDSGDKYNKDFYIETIKSLRKTLEEIDNMVNEDDDPDFEENKKEFKKMIINQINDYKEKMKEVD